MDWYESRKERWLNARVVAWAIFDLGVTMFSMIVISRYAAPWVTKQLNGGVLSFNVTYSLSIALAGAVQLLLGPVSDEWGRRRIFVVGFTALCVAACALMSLVHSAMAGLALFCLANVGYQVGFVFYNAMLSDVSDERHKTRISGIGISLGYVGSVLALLVTAPFVDVDHNVYSKVFWVTAVLVLVFALPLFFFVKERPGLVHFNLAQSLQNSLGSLLITLRRVGRHREMLFFFVGCILALDAIHTVIPNMTLYCTNVVGMDVLRGFDLKWKDRPIISISEINFFLIVSASFGILGAPIIGHIADKTSRYKALLVIVGLWMVALVLAMFSVQRRLFWFTGPLFGLGFGGIWTVSRAYLLEICHPEERGQMFALFGLVNRGAAMIGPLVWGGVYAAFLSPFGERKAYRMSIAAILVLTALGFWILYNARPRDAEKVR